MVKPGILELRDQSRGIFFRYWWYIGVSAVDSSPVSSKIASFFRYWWYIGVSAVGSSPVSNTISSVSSLECGLENGLVSYLEIMYVYQHDM